MVVQMIASGEEAGAVDEMLNKIAQFYDEEVEATTESLTALIEPLMIAFLGVVVGVDDHRPVHAHLQDLRPDPVTQAGPRCGPVGGSSKPSSPRPRGDDRARPHHW